jgi:sialate O-acetylesterase
LLDPQIPRLFRIDAVSRFGLHFGRMIPRLLAIRLSSCTAALLVLGAGLVHADVKLHNLFTDHMVLQRDIAVPVWGWADDGEKVTVEFRGQKVSTTAANGKWTVRLKKLKAGGPDTLKVTGKNSVTVQDVLVGEVWVASGQSNMEWAMRSSFEPQADIAAARNPHLRLFTVPKLKSDKPVSTVDSSWKQTNPETVTNFSAVGYYFGNSLQKALNVPVGIIHTSWGGSPAEVWMRHEILSSNTDYKRDVLGGYENQLKRIAPGVQQFEKEQAVATKEGTPFNKRRPTAGWKPSELYNGMIAPLLPYAIQGAIWYQGESNADRAYQYRNLFADMIRNWRKDWGQGNFPFLEVQLAPFLAIQPEPGDSKWAELREAQVLATKTLPKVGIAVITDFGDARDIHPKWKKPVGERLALAARGIVYDEKIVYSGPMYRSVKINGSQAVLSFDHTGGGLVPGTPPQDEKAPLLWETVKAWQAGNANALVGFTIAGENQRFYRANAGIQGSKVVVSSPNVPKPVAVRYGWADCPVVNLFNTDGLPASPFRTDDWPMVTAPKPDDLN